jgi:drug/metabolite transporter (DMT)-like permease
MKSINRSHSRIQADLLMFLAAVVWGGGFVAQRYATHYLSLFAFNGIRFTLAGLILLPVGLGYLRTAGRRIWWVVPAGLLLFGGSALQQAGLSTTTAGSAGFVTAVYVVFVPLFLALIWRQKVPAVSWLAALAALGGTYLLSTGGKTIQPSTGDLLELAGAVVWAFHIIVVGMAVRRLNLFTFSVGQFLICGVLNLALAQGFSPLTLASVVPALPALLYGGIISVALGFTLQAVGQKSAPAVDAALILSLESVFAAIFGAIILLELMNWIQIVGCVIIMGAIVIGQLISLRRDQLTQSTAATDAG